MNELANNTLYSPLLSGNYLQLVVSRTTNTELQCIWYLQGGFTGILVHPGSPGLQPVYGHIQIVAYDIGVVNSYFRNHSELEYPAPINGVLEV